MNYRKKPVIIQAVQVNHENLPKIIELCGDLYDGHGEAGDDAQLSVRIKVAGGRGGYLTAHENDWVIKGTKGECYPCTPDVFAEIYEAVP